MAYADDSTKCPYDDKQYNMQSPSPSPIQQSCLIFASAPPALFPQAAFLAAFSCNAFASLHTK